MVLGGTGKTGRRVVSGLQQRDAAVRVAARSGPCTFDWHKRETWDAAVNGVRAVYVVDSQTEDAGSLLSEFGDVAVAAGVSRFVLLSARAWQDIDEPEWFASESAVKATGAEWTVLRPTWFGQNFSEDPLLRLPLRDGRVVLPTGEGPEPLIDAEDIAAVAVEALTSDGHAGETYALSGPRLLTFAGAVREIAQATGREIEYVDATGDQYRDHLIERGFPLDHAELAAQLLGWVREGRGAYLSDGVQRVLGREPRDFGDFVRVTAATGVWRP
ncbi:NAD(P)H-binding protein [Streptomyces lonarensis]|uniref:NAD(P)H-binding protein n=1 Tax=Streptomyces lonarensis TaxID=700599 RepID=A0A7X6HXM2_9ACTN|nr:NAD(P)H-binding protein [Streptomyces lonarensis]